jgi:hypothetical protein
MSSNVNVATDAVKSEARLILERMLAEPKTADEKKVVEAKLADVSLTLQAVRSGKDVVVPMGWDENQQALWAMLKEYHGLESEVVQK